MTGTPSNGQWSTGRDEVLELTSAEPERILQPGDVLFDRESADRASMAVLVDGHLRIEVDGGVLSEITVPGDVRSQYADADGTVVVIDSVLGQLASRPTVDIEPGSDRAADYDG